jgi:cell division protein FtsI/penicillin-binding protein 2
MFTDSASKSYRRRLTVLAFCLTFGFAVIIGKLFLYQVIQQGEFKPKIESLVVREKTIPAKRGYITDINGNLLAMDVVQWEISASPPLIESPAARADELAELLGLPRDELYAKLTAPVNWVRIATHVDQEIGEAIFSLGDPGITCDPKPLRIYPEERLFAHLLGIVNDTGDGFYGVEGYYNLVLKGQDGLERYLQGPGGEQIPQPPLFEDPPEPGTNLVLTVDRNIQYIAQTELLHALQEYGAESGTVVIMEPETGAILAATSYPLYNPNDFAGTELSLLADPAVSNMWEPGSIFKVITWSAGLDSGTISPGTTFYDEGALEVGGRVIRNWDREGHGYVTMTDGLVQSLNTVASFISTSTGKDRFYNYLRRFGFGQLSNVDLDTEGPGMMKQPGDSNWFPSELGTNSFGQGIAVTPIQMITAISAVANRGMLMKPHIVHEFTAEDALGRDTRVVQVQPMQVRMAISQDTADTMTNLMVQVVDHGATKAQVPGYRIAGKTGTAQIPTAYGYHPVDTIASFVGFAPADDPQFIVLVKLDKPTASPWGSQTAAPTFKAIAERLLVYMQIPPDEIRLAQH